MTITLGPFTLPAQLLLAFLAIILGSAAGRRVAGTRVVNADGTLWLVIAGAVLVGRIAFVARYWAEYAEEPWRLPDLRDGGMDAMAGWVAAAVIGGLLAWRRRAQRRAIAGALCASLCIWVAGNGLLRMADTRLSLPRVTLTDLDGRTVSLPAFAGKPVVLNLWASWCPPCRREMPALGKAQQGAADLHFVFVNQGEDAAAVRAYLQSERLPLRNVVLDPGGALATAASAPGLPTTLFFDAQGMLVGKRMGELSSATLAEHLGALRARQ
ncbi:TlpA family protein disulfide reductase [Massilia oculi]|uniref:TlpA family protein disulfide reductase n=1 Tax=Massilia hydrophila TaxID=3044279 RepID=A0ABS7YGU9_9BURK|nr:TlpA disulfide reductase family protein [Massilia oculi]MCA1857469.1 TlpA family protein disulfide reductase [Massilia oculi]